MARNAQSTIDQAPTAGEAVGTADVAVEHLVHGLVAIANGPGYCLCGTNWPCDRREGRSAQR